MCVFHYNPVYMYVKSLRKRLCMRHALYLAAQSKTLNMSGLWRELHNEMGACMWVCEGVTLNLAVCFCQAANHSMQRPLKATGFLPQQVGNPHARMEKSPGDQVDGVGAHSPFCVHHPMNRTRVEMWGCWGI